MSKRTSEKELEQRAISLTGLLKPIHLKVGIHQSPLKVSIKRNTSLKFEGFNKIAKLLQSLSRIKLIPSNHKVNIKIEKRAVDNTIDYTLLLKSQSGIFSELLNKNREQIMEQANNDWLAKQNNK